jgi:hypothetical protein
MFCFASRDVSPRNHTRRGTYPRTDERRTTHACPSYQGSNPRIRRRAKAHERGELTSVDVEVHGPPQKRRVSLGRVHAYLAVRVQCLAKSPHGRRGELADVGVPREGVLVVPHDLFAVETGVNGGVSGSLTLHARASLRHSVTNNSYTTLLTT